MSSRAFPKRVSCSPAGGSFIKTVLVNDTSGTHNPGCQGTVHQLLKIASGEGLDIVSRLRVGYPDSYFHDCFRTPPIPSLAQRAAGKLNRTFSKRQPRPVEAEISEEKFESSILRLSEQLKAAWKPFELVLVNGEGTIHHQMRGAIGLVGLCAAAKLAGKQVALVNCSIFDLPTVLLQKLGKSVDQISVREPLSFRYLQDNGISATQSADSLFLMNTNEAEDTELVLESGSVIYTPGVLTSSKQVPERVVAEDIQQLIASGHSVYYWVVESEDEKLAGVAHQTGAKVIPLASIRWNHVPALMKAAEFVVSGRYHVNIFAALFGTPFVPMETNTSKMKGLLELTGGESFSVRAFDSGVSVADPAEQFLPSSSAIEACRALASQSFSNDHSIKTSNAGLI